MVFTNQEMNNMASRNKQIPIIKSQNNVDNFLRLHNDRANNNKTTLHPLITDATGFVSPAQNQSLLNSTKKNITIQ